MKKKIRGFVRVKKKGNKKEYENISNVDQS